jgi:ABC-type transport system substrate-binding protein
MSLAYNMDEEIFLVRNGAAIEARSPLPPGVLGHDPEFTLGPSYDPARAKALLDMFGYVDADGDGWREQPDGSPRLPLRPPRGSTALHPAVDQGLDDRGEDGGEVAGPDLRRVRPASLQLALA